MLKVFYYKTTFYIERCNEIIFDLSVSKNVNNNYNHTNVYKTFVSYDGNKKM